MNEFACSAYRSTLIRPAEREIKPPQNVVTNPFKRGGGGGLEGANQSGGSVVLKRGGPQVSAFEKGGGEHGVN